MYKLTIATVLSALALAVTTAMAQTVDVSGRVVRVDPGAQLIILDNNQALRVGPNTVLFVDNQPVSLAAVQPGQTVIVRAGEAVTVQSSPATAAQAPRSTVVVAPPAATPAVPSQTIYGRITDVETGEVEIKTEADSFKVKVPREVAAQLREGDSVRLDISFQR